jgi:hypothetical protein
MTDELLRKEFDEFFIKSPLAALGKDSQMYVAMYGAFMGGYIQSQQEIIKRLKESNI